MIGKDGKSAQVTTNHHNSRLEALGTSIISLRTCIMFFNEMVSRCGRKRRQRRGSENTKFIILTDLGTEGRAHHAGPHGKDSRMDRRQKARVRALHRLSKAFIGISTGKARQSRVNSLGLASWSTLGGLGATGCSLVT